jgi:hypothetical protein
MEYFLVTWRGYMEFLICKLMKRLSLWIMDIKKNMPKILKKINVAILFLLSFLVLTDTYSESFFTTFFPIFFFIYLILNLSSPFNYIFYLIFISQIIIVLLTSIVHIIIALYLKSRYAWWVGVIALGWKIILLIKVRFIRSFDNLKLFI